MPVVTKRELAIRVTNRIADAPSDVSQQLIAEIIQALIDEIADCLAAGNSVVMRRFGTFEVREMKAKLGRNPKKPEETVKIPARAGVKFRPGQELKDMVASSLSSVRERKKRKKAKK